MQFMRLYQISKNRAEWNFQVTSRIAKHTVQRLARALSGMNPGALTFGINQPDGRNAELKIIINFVLNIGSQVVGRQNFHRPGGEVMMRPAGRPPRTITTSGTRKRSART